MDLTLFEKRVGIKFKDQSVLKTAFTHRSFLNENRRAKTEHNERLEFLGDAVLELIVTDYLFKNYPEKNEGEMTSYRSALVNAVTLSQVASDLGMNDFLLLSRGEAKDTGRARQVILANTFEAVIGAIFVDLGYEVTERFVTKVLLPLAPRVISAGKWMDAKSLFQEKAQDIVGVTPSYKTLSEVGPDHDKKFTVGVYLGDSLVSKGEGKSKQEAEQSAAERGLMEKKWT